jgi:hypothetical protein
MPSLFCWGALMVPRLVLDQTDEIVIVQIEGNPQPIPISKIIGWAKEGDRVRVLMGYNWHIGTVLGGEILRVDLDKLGIVRIWKAGVLKPLYVPPTDQVGVLEIPDIEPNNEAIAIIESPQALIITPLENALTPAFEEGDRVRVISKDPKFIHLFGAVGNVKSFKVFSGHPLCMVHFKRNGEKSFPPDALEIAVNNLEPLKKGDRVRIVLAGPPLEYLTGLLGTVVEVEAFGLIPIAVDGHGEKLLRREQLDLIETETQISVGLRVKCDRAFKKKVGIVRKLSDTTAMVEFGEGIPLYPCVIASLRAAQ